MKTLDKKLVRDLLRLKTQAIAISLVMACGVAVIILAIGSSRSLEGSMDAFYDRYRFGSVFASATRAPRYLKDRIENIPGVSAVELRIVRPALMDVIGMSEPATGIAVSIPDFTTPSVNQLYLRQGRLPEPAQTNEVAIVETFALAHDFKPGDSFYVLLDGRKRKLTIVGIVLTSEYIYALGPGDMVPDPRRFGVLFMSEKIMSGIFDMHGAFNDAALITYRNADIDQVINSLDEILVPYGGSGAYDRDDQMSHAFLNNELKQLRAMAMVIPPIFLFISAFLVNMILSRLIALEREQIGLLKAVGYSNVAVGWHYAKLAILISLTGLVIGSIAGSWMGRSLTDLYATFYSFPFLIYDRSIDLFFIAGLVALASALTGAANAIWKTVILPPAIAMRPPAPTRYRSLPLGKLQTSGFLSQLSVMAIRHLIRWPFRSLLTALGTSLSVALLITALFSFDSIDYMIDSIFFQAERQDATMTFSHDLGPEASLNISNMPGVLHVEPFRSTAVLFRRGLVERRLAVVALPKETDLGRILDVEFNPTPPMSTGLMISERVADIMQVKVGDFLEVELLQKNSRIVMLPVTSVIQSFVGLTVYMSMEALDRVMMDGRLVSGVRVSLDDAKLNEIYTVVKETPSIATIALLGISRRQFRDVIEQNITTSTTVYIILAVIITFGVIYNSARIQLSERARELASLRVFGFTKREVSSVLVIELTIVILLAQPLGWFLGYWFSWAVTAGIASDLFRLPLIVTRSTYATASLVVMSAAIVSALVVIRRVSRLDLVRVLKTRE